CVFPLITVLHELGHAIAARFLRFRIFGISLGMGRTLHQWRFGKFRFEINSHLFMGGLTWLGSKSQNFYRTRFFLMILAGPAVNLLMLALLYAYAMKRPLGLLIPGTNLAPLVVLFITNALMLFSSLFPCRINVTSGSARLPILTDGLSLL